MTRLPPPLPPYLNTMLPFDWIIWVLILGTCAFAEVASLVIRRITNMLREVESSKESTLMSLFTMLCGQKGTHTSV